MALRMEGLARGLGARQVLLEIVGGASREVDGDERALGARGAGVGENRLLVVVPAIAHPGGHIWAVRGRGILAKVELDLALLPGLTVGELHALQRFAHTGPQELPPLARERGVVVLDAGEAVAILALPGGALAGLKTILVAHGHE